MQLTATKADALASLRCLPKGQLLAEALSDWPVQNNSTHRSLSLALLLGAAYPSLRFDDLSVDLRPHWKSTSIRETTIFSLLGPSATHTCRMHEQRLIF